MFIYYNTYILKQQGTTMSAKHVFENVCINFEEILIKPDIKHMLRVVKEQAKTTEAKKRTDIANADKYSDDEGSPKYFGMFVEWYAQEYLNHFGYLYNIANVNMLDVVGGNTEDLGVDGEGVTMTTRKTSTRSTISHTQGGRVYIQVKGTTNHNKEHQANDGSRLPNFATHAMSSAISGAAAYSSRYVLFTTGKGVHYKLKAMWCNLVEVIGIHDIDKLASKNVEFLNRLRDRVGLNKIEYIAPEMDAEAEYNLTQFEEYDNISIF
jgi:hypothetical protein